MPEPLSMLVPAAREGDQHAWDAIVDRFLPLVGAIVRGHRLSAADGDDVSQTVWLRLVEHLGALREPDALPGWIRTTTRNECLRLLAARGRVRPVDPQEEAAAGGLDAVADDVADDALLAAERHRLLREALGELPAARREPAPAAAHRPSAGVRGDQPPAGHPGGQHRTDPGAGAGPACAVPVRCGDWDLTSWEASDRD
ncbi:sigma-70 family RNA polymerase sigma factor [Nocardioides convexus]|uniref:RNA polymerase sigma factor n=1 Tax=Nocardioides convexus TaxID=2712224 RepID=UPI002418BBE4|nr:sigma-70 family RNA polymerase sigma factor [Nocardioides convexus]